MKLENVDGFYPSVCLTKDVTHFVWEAKVADAAKYGVFYANLTADGKLSEPVRVSGTVRYAEVPNISVRGSNIVVVFQSKKPNGKVEIHYMKSSDGGKTWA